MRLSEQQEELLMMAVERGGVSASTCDELYSFEQNFYRAVWSMEESGLLERKDAPTTSDSHFIWVTTEKGQHLARALN